MLHEIIPFRTGSDSKYTDHPRSPRPCYQEGIPHRARAVTLQHLNRLPEEPCYFARPRVEGINELEEKQEKVDVSSNPGHSLFQAMFFFCRVKKIGDAPGAECIYVETVVDRDSGVAFAKVFSTRSAMNAVDILASRVFPFFERRGIAIKDIHTRKTSEYCGLLPRYPFKALLASSHIQHLEMDQSSRPYNYLCEHFYRFLLKEFFPAALRRAFQLSLHGIQRDLDAFVEAYNAVQMTS